MYVVGRLGILVVGIVVALLQVAYTLIGLHLCLAAAYADAHLYGGQVSRANLCDDDVGGKLSGVVTAGIGAVHELEGKLTRCDGVDEQAVLRGEYVGELYFVAQEHLGGRGHEVETYAEVASAAQQHVGLVARRLDEGRGPLLSDGLVHVRAVDGLIACGGTDDPPGAHEAVQDDAVELCFSPEIFVRPLAEADDAGLVHAVGIAEDVFETQQVGHCAVEALQGVRHKLHVAGHAVRDETDVRVGGHADVGRVVSAADGCGRGVRAVVLQVAVRRAGLGEDAFRVRIGSPDGKRHAAHHRLCSVAVLFAQGIRLEVEHVPEGTDAVGAHVTTVIRWIGQVEAYVHHADDDAPPRIGRTMRRGGAQGCGARDDGGSVGKGFADPSAFDARHLRTKRQGCKFRLGNSCGVDVTPVGIGATAVFPEDILAVGLHEGEHTTSASVRCLRLSLAGHPELI